MNFVVGGYSYSGAASSFDPTFPYERRRKGTMARFRGMPAQLDLWGLSGKANIAGGVRLRGRHGRREGCPGKPSVCGLTDVSATVSVNFIGAPALSFEEYPHYKQGLLVGSSLAFIAPIGQYDATKLVNIGTNRWSFRPQIGVSQALDRLTLEFLGAVNFYTTNSDFFSGHVR